MIFLVLFLKMFLVMLLNWVSLGVMIFQLPLMPSSRIYNQMTQSLQWPKSADLLSPAVLGGPDMRIGERIAVLTWCETLCQRGLDADWVGLGMPSGRRVRLCHDGDMTGRMCGRG